MFYSKFTYFADESNPIIIGAEIRTAKFGKDAGTCSIYTDIHYNPIIDAVGYEQITLEKAKSVLSENGFVQVDFDSTSIDNKYDLEKIKPIAPADWFEKYEMKVTFEG